MTVHEATLEEAIDLSRRLSASDKLYLISVVSEELRREVSTEGLASEFGDEAGQETERSKLLAELRASGVLVEPSPQMLAHAAAWDALPEAEKEKTTKELRDLQLDISLSEIVLRARASRPDWKWIVGE